MGTVGTENDSVQTIETYSEKRVGSKVQVRSKKKRSEDNVSIRKHPEWTPWPHKTSAQGLKGRMKM